MQSIGDYIRAYGLCPSCDEAVTDSVCPACTMDWNTFLADTENSNRKGQLCRDSMKLKGV